MKQNRQYNSLETHEDENSFVSHCFAQVIIYETRDVHNNFACICTLLENKLNIFMLISDNIFE